ncbi:MULTISPECIES: hypothetical protein [Cyanophyceae]|uniref:hypothetical protein n=1 Tax=Cyanophyceae TaxID=3028117 RepID=UPI001685C122|nr:MULTISPECIES: hypothetical protein [Cyanophyceae]MBD1916194.1 hypothetical protein [Phormidium sp. FACHB-77]MBD2031537.1 hypothetical protein [Phormidium sp. FACHB-322]MBD2052836.1 hypothetical protein [Leptolyngbya sp. FACHB-60]
MVLTKAYFLDSEDGWLMPYQVRPATLDDLPSLTALLELYMQETFQRPWGGTPQRLA